jgi:hypothetical protein
LRQQVDNVNTDTEQLSNEQSQAIAEEVASNVYDLPSTERVIRYLHAAAGFPTKSTWLKAIKSGFFATWPMINLKNVTKHFPESEEMQKGHMRQIRSGTCKTNRRVRFVMEGSEQELQEIDADIRELQRKRQDIMIKVYDCTAAMYTDHVEQRNEVCNGNVRD